MAMRIVSSSQLQGAAVRACARAPAQCSLVTKATRPFAGIAVKAVPAFTRRPSGVSAAGAARFSVVAMAAAAAESIYDFNAKVGALACEPLLGRFVEPPDSNKLRCAYRTSTAAV